MGNPIQMGGKFAEKDLAKALHDLVIELINTSTQYSVSLLPDSSVGYPSGQRGQTVNLLRHRFGGSNPPPTTNWPIDHNQLTGPRCDLSCLFGRLGVFL